MTSNTSLYLCTENESTPKTKINFAIKYFVKNLSKDLLRQKKKEQKRSEEASYFFSSAFGNYGSMNLNRSTNKR